MVARTAPLTAGEQAFDLNIERVLEHWPVAYAVRELVANALDETALTGCADPDITKAADGTWVIRDYGRGLRYQVAIHACRILQTAEKVLFVTATQLGLPAVHYARDDGYRILVAPDDIVATLGKLTDLEGRPMFDLSRFNQEWNNSFAYTFVEADQLSAAEQGVYALTEPAAALAGADLAGASITVAVSETMRLSERGSEILGVWEPAERRIVVRRDQLADPVRWCATFLHELTHAISGTIDLSFAFEDALTVSLGTVAHTAISAGATSLPPGWQSAATP